MKSAHTKTSGQPSEPVNSGVSSGGLSDLHNRFMHADMSYWIGLRFASIPYIRMPADTEAFREEIVPRIGRLTM